MLRNRMTLEDVYVQLCQKNGGKIFDFGPFVVEYIEGLDKVNILSKPSLVKIVDNINRNIEEEELWEKL